MTADTKRLEVALETLRDSISLAEGISASVQSAQSSAVPSQRGERETKGSGKLFGPAPGGALPFIVPPEIHGEGSNRHHGQPK